MLHARSEARYYARHNFRLRLRQRTLRNSVRKRRKFLFCGQFRFARGLLLAIAPGDFAERFRLWISIGLLLRVLFSRSSSLLPLASFDARLIFRSQDGFSLQIFFGVDVLRRFLPGGFMRFFLARGFRYVLPTNLNCPKRNPDYAAEDNGAACTRRPPGWTTRSHSLTRTDREIDYRGGRFRFLGEDCLSTGASVQLSFAVGPLSVRLALERWSSRRARNNIFQNSNY